MIWEDLEFSLKDAGIIKATIHIDEASEILAARVDKYEHAIVKQISKSPISNYLVSSMCFKFNIPRNPSMEEGPFSLFS